MTTENQQWYHLISGRQRAVLDCLVECARKRGQRVYLVGGAVRDMMLGALVEDLDFAVECRALSLLDEVRLVIGSGTVIELGDAANDTARLVCRGLTIDVSGYRHGAVSIEEDLVLRDFTINSMAIALEAVLQPDALLTPVDPLGGREDLAGKLVRADPDCFDDDPLRMLRAYRFSAQLGFTIERKTIDAMIARLPLLVGIAAERISHELDTIMATPRASATVQEMGISGLLQMVLPELYEGRNVKQPPCHHLDVMEHNLQTLHYAERIVADPYGFFPDCEMINFGGAVGQDGIVELKWAALLHDVGKPLTRAIDAQRDGRITFYNHDELGAELIAAIGRRLRWSSSRIKRVAALVRMHMHPFHLVNVMLKDEELSKRAKLKICRRAGPELAPLFMLAMADSLAAKGPGKPAGIERQLVSMVRDLAEFYETSVQPVIEGPKLLTGHDLIATFDLQPGPGIGDLLEGVEAAAVEGVVTTKSEALDWVAQELSNRRK